MQTRGNACDRRERKGKEKNEVKERNVGTEEGRRKGREKKVV